MFCDQSQYIQDNLKQILLDVINFSVVAVPSIVNLTALVITRHSCR